MEYLREILNTQNYVDSNLNNSRVLDKYNMNFESDVFGEFGIDESRLSSSTNSECFSMDETDNDVFDDDCDSLCDEIINEIFSPSNNHHSLNSSIGEILGTFKSNDSTVILL
jgi:hypothetical protein